MYPHGLILKILVYLSALAVTNAAAARQSHTNDCDEYGSIKICTTTTEYYQDPYYPMSDSPNFLPIILVIVAVIFILGALLLLCTMCCDKKTRRSPRATVHSAPQRIQRQPQNAVFTMPVVHHNYRPTVTEQEAFRALGLILPAEMAVMEEKPPEYTSLELPERSPPPPYNPDTMI